MPAYLIVNIEIKDAEKIKKYLTSTPEILNKYSGRFLVRGGQIWVAEGNWNPKRLVVVEFDSFEKAKEFYDSEQYEHLKKLRQSSAKTDMIIVNGITNEMSDKLNKK
ncbi:MAG: hypothetical protein ACJA2M_001700 [Polaribacter sp.]|jgi:uncharacterized protein (DUF1330 family)